MNIKPSDIFIGVVDFFSVLLPGALLTYFLIGTSYQDIFGVGKVFPEPTTEAARWIIFLVITYILGNIIFLVSSFLDKTYNKVLFRGVFQKNYDLSYKTARAVQWKFINADEWITRLYESKQISTEQYKEIINTKNHEIFNVFKWGQHFLQFQSPEALTEIQKTVADSKFFRSLVATFVLISIFLFVRHNTEDVTFGIIFIVLSLFCYYRYGDLRFKSTEKTYELIITKYCMHPTSTQMQAHAVSTSSLKQEPSPDFLQKHKERISFLIEGFKKNINQVTVNPGDFSQTSFISNSNEAWHCLAGNGVIEQIDENNNVHTILLVPGAVIPIKKGAKTSFTKIGQPVDFIVVDNS